MKFFLPILPRGVQMISGIKLKAPVNNKMASTVLTATSGL